MTDRKTETQRSNRSPQKEIQKRINYESPSKYDLDFYQRKVNRLQNDLAQIQDELGLARFRLHKAQDFQIKYEILVKQNQTLSNQNQKLARELTIRSRQIQDLKNRVKNEETLKNQQENETRSLKQELSDNKIRFEQFKEKSRNQAIAQKINLENNYTRQYDNLKKESKDIQTSLKLEIEQLKEFIASKVNSQQTNAFKLQKLRNDKNQEIQRLTEIIGRLKSQNTDQSEELNSTLLRYRDQFHEETNSRLIELTTVSQSTKTLLMKQIENLKQTLNTKNDEIFLLLDLEKRFMDQHERVTNELKAHIIRLQDKIFLIHRQNELELFNAIERLKTQHNADIKASRDDFQRIQNQYDQKVNDLNNLIGKLKEERAILESHIKKVEESHWKLSEEKEKAITGLSQKILKLEAQKDQELKNITTSVRLIQEQAQSKIRDLHAAMLAKHGQTDVLTAQLALKNKQIGNLLDEIHRLRNENRQRIQKLEDIYTRQQLILQEQNGNLRKQILSLRRQINQLKDDIEDQYKKFKLEEEIRKEELLQQKQANERLKTKNQMLLEYSKQLEDDLKRERNMNVNVLQDANVVRREVIQERQKVKGEMEVIKNKEIQQMRNIFNIDLNKVRTENANLSHKLREKSDQYNKLLNDFKDLESKLSEEARGKQSRAEDQARKKATLECQILLTRNIVNAISDADIRR